MWGVGGGVGGGSCVCAGKQTHNDICGKSVLRYTYFLSSLFAIMGVLVKL